MTPEQICQSISADSLGYISLEGMIAATNQPASRLCAACFTGSYPIELPAEAQLLGKNILEQIPLPLGAPEDNLTSLLPSLGGAGALGHP
jgi:amidophosphoribosyltransferase